MRDYEDWPPDYLVEAELPNGDLLVMTQYAEPFCEPGWVETIVRPAEGEFPTRIWGRIMVEQSSRNYDAIDEAMSVLTEDERNQYRARAPQLLERN